MTARQKHLGVAEYLGHMEEAAALASGYVQGMAKEEFILDKKTQQAVIYNILIIGEAATQVLNEHPDFVEKHPDIPWREMRGIRNRMAHGYFELNLDIVWETAIRSLNSLKSQIASAKSTLPLTSYERGCGN